MTARVDPFDPSRPLDYTKLGGDPAKPTPTQYSWITSVCFLTHQFGQQFRNFRFSTKNAFQPLPGSFSLAF